MTKLEECKTKIAKVNGLPPYNTGYNPCYGDAYMVASINKDYDFLTINAAIKELKEENNYGKSFCNK